MSENLVLWKPRSQRVAEGIILPLILLPIGPSLRELLGDEYLPPYGLALSLFLTLMAALVFRWWATARDGEWMTAADRLKRLLAERATTAPWKSALKTASTYTLMLTAVLLDLQSVGDFGSGFGGPASALGCIAAVSVVITVPILTGRYKQLASVKIEQSELPSRQILWHALRLLPRSYLATLLGTAGGLFAGLRLPESLRVAGFLISALLLSQLLRQLPFFGKLPKTLHASLGRAQFLVYLALGIASWGVPFGIIFSGFLIVTGLNQLILSEVADGMRGGFGFGLFMGIWLYLINRLTQRRTTETAA